MRLLIVIPTLDEEPRIESSTRQALTLADEVCISDGGSSDQSVQLARQLGVRCVTGQAGRGGQLNRGVAGSDCDLLLFLHADSVLPQGARQLIEQAIADGAVGGGFNVRYLTSSRILEFGNRLIAWRTRLTGCPLGDQGQFVTRRAFEALGGFRDWPILEDLDFIRRLKRHGRTIVLPAATTTSPRRFEKQGILRTIAINWLIWALYFVGVSPLRLARLYRHIR